MRTTVEMLLDREELNTGLSVLDLNAGVLRAGGGAATLDLEVDGRPRDFVLLCEDGEGTLLPRGMKKLAKVSEVRSLSELCTAVCRALSLQAELHVTIYNEDFAAWVIPSSLSDVPPKAHVRITPATEGFTDFEPQTALTRDSSAPAVDLQNLMLSNMSASESLEEDFVESDSEPYVKGSRGCQRFRGLPGNVKLWCIMCIIGTVCKLARTSRFGRV